MDNGHNVLLAFSGADLSSIYCKISTCPSAIFQVNVVYPVCPLFSSTFCGREPLQLSRHTVEDQCCARCEVNVVFT